MVFRCKSKNEFVEKGTIFLVSVGGLVVIGLALSVLGNQIIFEDFAKKEAIVESGSKISIEKTMEESDKGIFAIQTLELKKDTIYATVTDPFENQIVDEVIDKEAYEGYFDVSMSGNYTLTVYNVADTDATVAGYIGPEPDATKQSIAFISIYILFVGLIGMVVAIIYVVINRRKR